MKLRLRQRPLALCVALLGATAGVPAFAQTSDAERIRLLEGKLEQSLQLIEALGQKLDRLQRQLDTHTPPPATSPAPGLASRGEAPVPAPEMHAGNTTAHHDIPADAGMPMRGFADVVAGYSGEDSAEFGRGSKGFSVGTFDLYLAPSFGSKVRSLIELAFEIEHGGEAIADLERAQLGYAFSDAMTLWMGRFHTPYGYWNTAFHHGAQLQTSILRPRFLDFEDMGGIMPAHGVGLWATGRLPSTIGQLEYDLYLANAPSIVDSQERRGTLDIHASGREDFHALGGFSLALSPRAAPGLKLGVHGLASRVDADNGNRSRLGMLGGFMAFDGDGLELLAEGYAFRNRDLAGEDESRSSSAWYVQAAYDLGRITPFVRLERTDLDQSDPYFRDQLNGRSYRRVALGLRYELDPKAALKFEYDRSTKQDLAGDDDRFDEARVQYAIRF